MSMTNVVHVVCIGSRRNPHLKRRIIVDHFRQNAPGEWEALGGLSVRRAAAQEQTQNWGPDSKNLSWDLIAEPAETPGSNLLILPNGEPLVMPENPSFEFYMEHAQRAAEGRSKFNLSCSFCKETVTARDDTLGRLLDAVVAGEHETPLGARTVSLSWLGATLSSK